jgi:capsular exopolysaccharide synthesis family protein
MSRFHDALLKGGHPPVEAPGAPADRSAVPGPAVPVPAVSGSAAPGPAVPEAAVFVPGERAARRPEDVSSRDADSFEMDAPFAVRAVTNPDADPAFVDEFRKLAATLHHAQMQHDVLRVVSIASAAPKEGKTLTAINLALTLRVSYQRRVLLIDADLRAPSVHRWLGLPVAPGLSDQVSGPPLARWPISEIVPGLFVMPAGTPTRDPVSRLSSDRMRALVAEARERYDWVIVDLSPLGPSPDAQLVTALSDGTILVIDAGTVPARVIQRALDAIGEEKVIGVVMNRMPPAALGDAYGAYPEDYAANARTSR